MTQGQLSEHFDRAEFACHCGKCNQSTADAELIRVLENVRGLLGGRPVTILSGHRCLFHNQAVGGARNSYHLLGKAADIMIAGVSANTVADCLEDVYHEMYGIIRYNDFTHIDVRDGVYREDKRKG